MSNHPHSQPQNQPQPETIRYVPIYLTGPTSPVGIWCAICAMFYMGTISAEKEFQAYVKELHQKAINGGGSFCTVDMPERDDLQLQPPITTAYGQFFHPVSGQIHEIEYPVPVCWTHIKGFSAVPKGFQRQSPIVPGKSYGRGDINAG